jgi:arylesterase / paraoxonase
VSSQEHRGDNRPGAIFSVPLAAGGLGPPKPFEVAGRDGAPFHPHGISLAVTSSRTLLYVINHLTEREHAVEVFEVERDRLLFRERLTSTLLTSPNDLVALVDGHVYVTNMGPSRGVGGFLSMLLSLRRGNVVHYHAGKWTMAADKIAYANGIAVSAAGDTLYVAGVRDKAIHVYARRLDTGEIDPERRRSIDVGSGVDNLTWADEHTLLVAAHPKALAFLGHARRAGHTAPSEVYRIDVRRGTVTLFYADDGTTISAASTALLHEGRLYLGQVFDDAVVSCARP